MELPFSEIAERLDTKYFASSSTGYTLPTSVNEIGDINLMLKSSPLDDVEVNTTIDEIRLNSKLTTNESKKFNK